jgi:hypothetical protein
LYGFQLFFKFYVFDVTIYVWVIILNMAMRKQKLSPEASKAKAVRDKKIAMTPHRKKRKRDNERMGQRSDSDIHHPSGGGPAVRVSIKNNRGNFGKGTKIEGPNMMGQTWLNRRIKGPNAEGDPVKKKKGGEGDPVKKKGGVIPYVTYDRDDPRIQAHSDSLASYNSSNNEYYEQFKYEDDRMRASEAAYESRLSDEDRAWLKSKGVEYKPEPLLSKQEIISRGRKWAEPVTDVKYDSGGGDPSKQWHYVNYKPRTATTRSFGGVAPGTPGHSSMKNKSIKPTSFIHGDGYVDAVFFDKPKQEVILKDLEKMPIRKLKSESTSNEVPELNHPQWYRMKDKKVMGTNGKWESAYQYKTRKGLSNKQMYRSFPELKPDK